MSVYNIKSATLHRLASVCNFFEPTTSEDIKSKINTVRLENRYGNAYAIASNQKIASIEYLGKTDNPDGAVHLILSEKLLYQAHLESITDFLMTITAIPEIAISTLQSNSGFNMADCCYWWGETDTPLAQWGEWGTEAALTSQGAMYWDLNHVEALIKASPSSKVRFPEFIDVNKPVVLRDYYNPNWVGVFMARVSPTAPTIPAELPEWWAI